MILRGPALLTLLAITLLLAASDYKDICIGIIFLVLLCLSINVGTKSNGEDDR